jgi:hypothetical protein
MVTQDNISSIGNKNICHGLGCFNIATNSIEEDGCDVTLMLCDDYIIKFPREVTDKSRKFNRFPDHRVLTPPTRTEQSNRGGTEL